MQGAESLIFFLIGVLNTAQLNLLEIQQIFYNRFILKKQKKNLYPTYILQQATSLDTRIAQERFAIQIIQCFVDA